MCASFIYFCFGWIVGCIDLYLTFVVVLFQARYIPCWAFGLFGIEERCWRLDKEKMTHYEH